MGRFEIFAISRMAASLNAPCSPETMASTVATPLEREFSTIAGIQQMSSTNSQGSTDITVQFTLDRSIDAAAQDVQAHIASAKRRLPPSSRLTSAERRV